MRTRRPTSVLIVDALGARLVRGETTVAAAPTDGCISGGEVHDTSGLADAVRDLGLRRGERPAVAFTTPRLLSRVLGFPAAMPDRELAAAVAFAAADALPVGTDGLTLAHSRLPGTPEHPSRVLLIAVPRDVTARLDGALAGARIRHASLQPLGAALAGLAPRTGLHAVVDAGALTTVTVAEDGHCAFTRTAPTGLETAITEAAERLGCPRDAAMPLLEAAAAAPSEADVQLAGVAQAAIDRLVSEVQASLAFHQRMAGGAAVDTLTLVGQAAGWPGAQERIAEALGLEVRVAHAVPEAAALAVAAGGGLTLDAGTRPGELDWHSRPVQLVAAGVAAVGIIATLGAAMGNRVESRQAELHALQAAAPAPRPQPAAPSAATGADAWVPQVQALVDARFTYEDVLAGVAWAAGSHIRLDVLRVTQQPGAALPGGQASALRATRSVPAVEVLGCAPDNRAVGDFLDRVLTLPGITSVALDHAHGRGNGHCTGRAEFTAVGFYEHAGDQPASTATPASATTSGAVR